MDRIKSCKVCGDQATGFNYSSLTCESCKVFYHRYGFEFSRNKFTCKQAGNCEINIQTRRHCKHCRLKKCFSVGMKRHSSSKEANANSNALVPVANSPASPITINDDFDDFLKEINITQISSFLISPFTGLSSINFQANSTLSDYESVKINEIVEAIGVIVDEKKLPLVRYTNNYYDSFISGEIYVRMFIKFCKRITAFTVLSEADQILLLKPFIFDILMIRFAFILDPSAGGWPVLMDSSKTMFAPFNSAAVSNIFKNHLNLFIENYDFTVQLQQELEGDVMLRDLYTVLSMFKNLADSRLSCPEFLRYNFILYSRLLRRYLQLKYNSKQKAFAKLEKLIQMATQFTKIRENERMLFFEMDLRLVPRIYQELYDLI